MTLADMAPPRSTGALPDSAVVTTGLSPTLECTMRVGVEAPQFVGAGPFGVRIVGGVNGGTVTGERLNGTVVGPAADWLLLGADGFTRVDVRLQVHTNDGAVLYVQYVGLLEMNEVSTAALLDPDIETDWDDQYFRTTLRFETGDERYAWVNQSVFVARGRIVSGGLLYEISRV